MRAGQPPHEALRAASYRKSSRSSGAQECVLVGAAAGWVGVQDSKLGADGPTLAVPATAWRALIAAIRADEVRA